MCFRGSKKDRNRRSWSNYIKSKKKCKIFGKYGGYKKGEHSRDFIYVEDCNKIAIWLLKKDVYGIFNVGTGKSIKFIDVANSIIKKIGYGKIEFVNFPKNLKKTFFEIEICFGH